MPGSDRLPPARGESSTSGCSPPSSTIPTQSSSTARSGRHRTDSARRAARCRRTGSSHYIARPAPTVSSIGIAEAAALRTLAASGFSVAAIGAPNLPDTHDLYLLRDAAPTDEYLRQFPAHGAQVLLSTGEGLFVAIPADTSIEELHFPVTRHGHNLKLLPSPALLQVDDRGGGIRAALRQSRAGGRPMLSAWLS